MWIVGTSKTFQIKSYANNSDSATCCYHPPWLLQSKWYVNTSSTYTARRYGHPLNITRTGHGPLPDPRVGSAVFRNTRVGSGRVGSSVRFLTGRVGSGRVGRVQNTTGRAGSEMTRFRRRYKPHGLGWVRSYQVMQKSHGSGRVTTRDIRVMSWVGPP